MIKINVILNNINWKKYLKNPNSFFDKKISLINKKNKLYKKNVFICSLLLSDSVEIKKLNKKFRNKNKPTDILSFPFENKIRKKNVFYLGDIIISYNFMDKPKSQNLSLFKDKVIKTFIHGFLHLLGFDHIKLKDYYKMFKEEKNIYQSVIKKVN